MYVGWWLVSPWPTQAGTCRAPLQEINDHLQLIGIATRWSYFSLLGFYPETFQPGEGLMGDFEAVPIFVQPNYALEHGLKVNFNS